MQGLDIWGIDGKSCSVW